MVETAITEVEELRILCTDNFACLIHKQLAVKMFEANFVKLRLLALLASKSRVGPVPGGALSGLPAGVQHEES